MVSHVDSDTAYLVLPGAKNRIAGVYYLSALPFKSPSPLLNGRILVEYHTLRHVVLSAAEAEVAVTCQRCLEAMPVTIASKNTLAVVWTDEEARHLPKHLDPVISEEACDLWELVEDELILALPAFSNHSNEDCNKILVDLSQPTAPEAAKSDKPNPFDVLAQLKPGKE